MTTRQRMPVRHTVSNRLPSQSVPLSVCLSVCVCVCVLIHVERDLSLFLKLTLSGRLLHRILLLQLLQPAPPRYSHNTLDIRSTNHTHTLTCRAGSRDHRDVIVGSVRHTQATSLTSLSICANMSNITLLLQ